MSKRLKYLQKHYNIYDDYYKVIACIKSSNNISQFHTLYLLVCNFEDKWAGHSQRDYLSNKLRHYWRIKEY